MSKRSANAARMATRDAMSFEDWERLFGSASPSTRNAERQQRQNEDKRQSETVRPASKNKSNEDSAKILRDNLWLQPYLELAKQAGAQVTQIKESRGCVALTIKIHQGGEGDRVKVRVSEGGIFQILEPAQYETLGRLTTKMEAQAAGPQRNLYRVTGYDRLER